MTTNGYGAGQNGATDREQAAPKENPFQHAAPEGAAKKTSEVLGEIMWLISQSPLHKRFIIKHLEWFVMTPILLQQFRLYYDQQKPIGVVLWAHANDETAKLLADGVTKLRPQDWKSGDQAWIVEVIAPFGGAEEIVGDLKQHVFAETELRVTTTTAQGKQVRVV